MEGESNRPSTSYGRPLRQKKRSSTPKTSSSATDIDDSKYQLFGDSLQHIGETTKQRVRKIDSELEKDLNGINNRKFPTARKRKKKSRQRNQTKEQPLDQAKGLQAGTSSTIRVSVFDHQEHPQRGNAVRKTSESAERFAKDAIGIQDDEQRKSSMNSITDKIPRKKPPPLSHQDDNKLSARHNAQPPPRHHYHPEAQGRQKSQQQTLNGDWGKKGQQRGRQRKVPVGERKPPPPQQQETINLCDNDSDAETVDETPQSKSSTRAAPPSSGERPPSSTSSSSKSSSTATSSTASSSRTSSATASSAAASPSYPSSASAAASPGAVMSSTKKRKSLPPRIQIDEHPPDGDAEETRKSLESVAVVEAIGNDYSQTGEIWAEQCRNKTMDDANVEVVDVDNENDVKDPPKFGILNVAKNAMTAVANVLSPVGKLGFSKQNNNRDAYHANKKQRSTYGINKGTPIVPGLTFTQPSKAQYNDDKDYDPDEENDRKPKAQKRKRGVSPTSFHDKKRESANSTGTLQLEFTRRPTTRSAAKRLKTPEVFSIDSSDSEPEMSFESETHKWDAVRIAIGKKVHSLDCSVTWEHKNQNMRISFKSTGRGIRTRRQSAVKPTEHTLNLEEDLRELKFYYAEQGGEDEKLSVDDEEQMSFLAMRIKQNAKNDLKKLNTYAPEGTDLEKRYILIEFRADSDLKELLHEMRSINFVKAFAAEGARLDASAAKEYGKAFLEDSRKDAKRRLQSMGSPASHKKQGFLAGKNDDDILVVYPFGADKELIETAATELKEASGDPLGGTDPHPIADSAVAARGAAGDTDKSGGDSSEEDGAGAKGRSRSHFLTIRVSDYERLEPLEWLNDTLVDFWMRWISRNDDMSDVHFFSSHFYSTLQGEGPSAVTKWTENKGIDVFKKRCIFVPINKNLHWSICAVINPGEIMNHRENVKHAYDDDGSFKFNEDDPFPCILFFDSLRAHQKQQVARNIRSWLNSEWTRLGKTERNSKPFDVKSMVVFSPKIPYQDNSWDCGVFVCRYAYAVYLLLRRSVFSYREAEAFSKGRRFKTLITESPEFDFDMDDIDRIRAEMKTLIQELSKIYAPWKQEQDRKEKEEKNAKRAAKAAKASNQAVASTFADASSTKQDFSQESKDSSVVVIGDDKDSKEEICGGRRSSAVEEVEKASPSDDKISKIMQESAKKKRSQVNKISTRDYNMTENDLFPAASVSSENGAFV